MVHAALAAAAISFVAPYLISLGKVAAKGAAGEAGKSVWTWIKGKLISPAGAAAVADAEAAPQEPENMQALQATLTKALKAEPDAAKALADMLKEHGASLSTQSANVIGNNNKTGQASGGSSVTIG
jgi:cytochrome c-type biogenesis protein CcmH/NrfG